MKKLFLIYFLLALFISLNAKEIYSKNKTNYLQLVSFINNNNYNKFKLFFYKNNINPNVYNIYTPTLLNKAISLNRLKFIKLLVHKGADFEFISGDQNVTAAHLAIKKQYYNIAYYFILRISNLNIKDFNGQTLLHLSVQYSANFLIEFLLKRGANKNIMNKQGQTPYDLAKNNLAIDITLLKKLNIKQKEKKIIYYKKNKHRKSKRININAQEYIDDFIYIGG